MGKPTANRTWVPPRRTYNKEEDRQPSPPPFYETKVNSQDILGSCWFSWEEEFCKLAGIPWEKIVAANKSICCHEKVKKWDDSAAKDVFLFAKERFRAMIDGLPWNGPIPDPDMYIDNVNWNSRIDPGLISDLDKEFFNPHEAEKSAPGPTIGQNESNANNDYRPWESYLIQNNEDLKDEAKAWNGCGNSLKSNIAENPLEQIYVYGDGVLKVNKWENGGRDCNQELENLDSRRPGGKRALSGDCRKREASHQHTWRYKSRKLS